MKLTVHGALQRLDNDNALFTTLMRHGSLTVEMYRPRGEDLQQPHTRDELYVVATGSAHFEHAGETSPVAPGDVLFVPAGAGHRFIGFSDNFSTWVFFYGPEGGESP